jgi:F-type H+-transporting ATPase subunit gamma
MATLKELRSRISSVKSTRKITKAMQMVAASKLRRAQDAAEQARPYDRAMQRVIANLSQAMGESSENPLLAEPETVEKVLLIVVSGERGLAGPYNTNIVRKAKERVNTLTNEGKAVRLMTVGRKGREVLKRTHADIMLDHTDLPSNAQPGFELARKLGEDAFQRAEEENFDTVEIVFAEFKNVMTQTPQVVSVIPSEPPSEDDGGADLRGAVYEFEPDEETILSDLLPKRVNMQIFKALLENAAGEQGARMTAMDSATRNAGELIDDLTLQYNRSRQEKITKELIEIVSGAEAL